MKTYQMSIDQIKAWLALEGWHPVDEGRAAFNRSTLCYVAVYDASEFNTAYVRELYAYIVGAT